MTARSKRRARICVALMMLAPLLSTVPLTGIVLAEEKPAGDIKKGDAHAEFIAEAAQRFELPAAWIRSVMHAESDGDLRALSPKGAIGLMQIMPETWEEIRVRHHLGDDPYDPHDNIIAGSAYIRLLYDRYGAPGWIAAYNAGPSRYESSLKGRPLPSETRAYVAAVVQNLDGKSVVDNSTTALSVAHLWTRAPLFVAQPDRTTVVDPLPKGTTAEAPPAPTVSDVSAIAPQSNGLFVTRVDGGQQP